MHAKTLHIVGNGFDLNHELETSFSDFRSWLIKKNAGIVCYLERFYPQLLNSEGPESLWRNFESALAAPKYDLIYTEAIDGYEIDYDHYMRSTSQIADAPIVTYGNDITRIGQYLEEWIQEVENKQIKAGRTTPKEIPYLDVRGLFLSFNYTSTLETIYDIPESQVIHIHGYVDSKKTASLVVGFDEKDLVRPLIQKDTELFQVEAYDNIMQEAIRLKKPVWDVIEKHHKFFKQETLGSVETIIVYGHSLADVDMPYFLQVKRYVQDRTFWYFSRHNEDDNKAINHFVAMLNIDEAHYQTFEF